METLINNYLAKERAFYCLNERFVSNTTGDIIFSTKIFRTVQTINTSWTTCSRMPKHRTFPWRKITKCEQRTIETLISNFFIKKRIFYHLNEWSVSNITGDIIFSTRIFRTLNSDKHFANDLPTRAETQIFVVKTLSSHVKIGSSNNCFNFLPTFGSFK